MGELKNPRVHRYFREDYFNQGRCCFLSGSGTIYRRPVHLLEKGKLEIMVQELKIIIKESREVKDTLFFYSMALPKYYQITHFMWEDCVVDKPQ